MALRLPVSAFLTLAIGVAAIVESPALADRERAMVAAVARPHPSGGDAVYLPTPRASRQPGRKPATVLWRGSNHERIVTDLRWSRHRDALAFATRNRRGAMTLVVVLVGGTPDGHVMTWPIPAPLQPLSTESVPTVTWLGQDRVGFGRSEVRPDVVASWRVRQ